jgi:hypothetical protein
LNDAIAVPAGYYHMFTVDGDFVYDPSNNYAVELITRYGDFYGGIIYTLNPSFNYIFNKYFRINFNYEYNHIKFPAYYSDNDNAIYTSHLFSANFTLTFSSKFSVKLLAQYDNLSNLVSGNFRIRYNPREGTDLYIVLNENVNTAVNRLIPPLPFIGNQAVTIKYSKTFDL